MMNCFRIAGIAVRELLYERVFYIFLCFGIVSFILSLMLGQLTYAEQSKLTLDFMLGGIQISMILFSVFMGVSLFQRELTLGSVSMVLSKPISRATFLLGKYLGQVAVQLLVCLGMGLVTMLICSRFGETVSYLAIFQTVVLILLEASVLSAITFLFAVNAGVITTAVATLCVFAVGHLGDPIANNIGKDRMAEVSWRLVRTVAPDLEVFNMKTLASFGYSITMTEMAWALVYAVCCVAFFLFAAVLCFNRKDIFT